MCPAAAVVVAVIAREVYRSRVRWRRTGSCSRKACSGFVAAVTAVAVDVKGKEVPTWDLVGYECRGCAVALS